jgi:glycosyltransferase involved in cell wall biosynthesis
MSRDHQTSVLCFLHCFDSGGVERTALRLCSAWANSGVRVKLLIGRDEGRSKTDAAGLERITFSSGRLSTARFETLWLTLCLWRQLRRERPDVIFCAGNTYAIIAVIVRLLMGRNCPPIVAKISNSLDRADMNVITRVGYRLWLRLQGLLLDHIVGTGPAAQQEVLASMKPSPDRLSIIRNPALTRDQLDQLTRIERKPPAAGRRFLAAGRLARQKRFDVLIRAFLQGTNEQDQLIILGEGPERRSLEHLIVSLGGSDRISLPGHMQHTAPWFRTCHVFVLCSDYEGLPSVVIEALAAGMAIVATECSATIHDLLEGGLGLLVEPRDVVGLAQALGKVGWASPFPDLARAKAQLHCVEHSGPKYIELMNRLVASDRRPAEQQTPARAEVSAP